MFTTAEKPAEVSPAEVSPAKVSCLDIYTLPDLKARFGIGRDGLRSARRKGLIVRRCGRKSFVTGRDLVAYLESCPVVA